MKAVTASGGNAFFFLSFLINNVLDRETWVQFIHSCLTVPYLAVICGSPSHGIACG